VRVANTVHIQAGSCNTGLCVTCCLWHIVDSDAFTIVCSHAFVQQITMLLSYASRELSKHNVLVKNLHGMDTLGAITLLASDKTGTLTMNVMVSEKATHPSIRLVIPLTMLIVAAVL
jgi:P-type E1-E2 ATPase